MLIHTAKEKDTKRKLAAAIATQNNTRKLKWKITIRQDILFKSIQINEAHFYLHNVPFPLFMSQLLSDTWT